MSKTKIDWCNAVWNPVWGCLHDCSFCYAKKFARRFYRNIAKSNGLSKEETEKLGNFHPTFLPQNFCREFGRKERIIFVNSMSDIAFWEKEWIERVTERIKREEGRIFLFLTKDPRVYKKFPKELPDNVWLGISATTNSDFQERTKELLNYSPTQNIFVSLEPLLSQLDRVSLLGLSHYRWVIVGPQTGSLRESIRRKYLFFSLWVEEIKYHCLERRIPLFTKESCKRYGVKLVKQYPFELEVKSIRR